LVSSLPWSVFRTTGRRIIRKHAGHRREVPDVSVHDPKQRDDGAAIITNKLKRGTFSATFFLACLAAMELEGVALDEI